jgi:hypothetical protein
MQARYLLLLGSLAGAVLGVAAFAKAPEPVGAAPRRSRDQPVVVELFTSEGCSSCPAADDVLARFERTQPVPGVRIVPLAFHVDYWDELGWPDPFASPSFTSRQGTYSTAGRVYTPQAIVDGRTELVGSDASGLRRAVERAALGPHASIDVVVRSTGEAVQADVRVGALPPGPLHGSSDATVFVALTQAHATVQVLRGENAGKTLQHTAIVRTMQNAGTVGVGGGEVHAALRVPSGIQPAQLRVVAFVQRNTDHAVLGSTEGQSLPAEEEP